MRKWPASNDRESLGRSLSIESSWRFYRFLNDLRVILLVWNALSGGLPVETSTVKSFAEMVKESRISTTGW